MKPQLFFPVALCLLAACTESNLETDLGAETLKNKQNTVYPISEDNWRDVDYISGQIATKKDMKAGRAVFFSPSGTTPYDMPLPALAHHIDSENGKKAKVVIVQAELGPDGTIVGAIYFNGDHLLATLNEFEIIEN